MQPRIRDVVGAAVLFLTLVALVVVIVGSTWMSAA